LAGGVIYVIAKGSKMYRRNEGNDEGGNSKKRWVAKAGAAK
jgi:hypothetical protein